MWSLKNRHHIFLHIFHSYKYLLKNPPIIKLLRFNQEEEGLMDNPNIILTLLGIPNEKVAFYDAYESSDGNSRIYLELVDERPSCPKCGSNESTIHGYYEVTINNSIIRAHRTLVEIRMRRYKCKKCGKTFKETYSFYMPYRKISRATEIAIIEDLKECVSYAYIGRQYDLSRNTIINIFDSLPRQPREKLTQVICVDEFHFSNNKNKNCQFPFVISSPYDARILDIIEARRWEYLRSYFVNVSPNERNEVKYFVSDMNETYRKLKKAFFPNATHIIDHFHVAKLFTNAIQKVRTTIMKREEYKSKEYLFLKKNWKMFLMNRHDLRKCRKVNKNTGEVTDFELLVDQTLRQYQELNEVYQAREEFYKYSLKLHYWMESKNNLEFFIKKFKGSFLKELNEIASTLENWFDEIVNSYAKTYIGFCLSNAVAEANNNTIQTLIDVGYGYGNFDRLRNRVLYINRNKKTNPE